jgi:hypothetical protein
MTSSSGFFWKSCCEGGDASVEAAHQCATMDATDQAATLGGRNPPSTLAARNRCDDFSAKVTR